MLDLHDQTAENGKTAVVATTTQATTTEADGDGKAMAATITDIHQAATITTTMVITTDTRAARQAPLLPLAAQEASLDPRSHTTKSSAMMSHNPKAMDLGLVVSLATTATANHAMSQLEQRPWEA